MKKLIYLNIMLVLIASCSSDDDDSPANPSITQLAPPTFSVASGTYTEAQTIEITSSESDVVILYAINDDIANAQVYSTPIEINMNGDYTIVARATKSGFEDSDIAQLSITIDIPQSPLKRVEYRSETGNIFNSYDLSYNSDGQLTSVNEEDGERIYNLSYDNELITSIEVVDEGSSFAGTYPVTYTNGLITQIGTDSQLDYTFEYNGDAKVDLWTRENPSDVFTEYVYDTDGNVSSVISYQEGGDMTTPDIELTYSSEMNNLLSDLNIDQAVLLFTGIIDEEELLFSTNLADFKTDINDNISGEISYEFNDDGRIKEINDYMGERVLFKY